MTTKLSSVSNALYELSIDETTQRHKRDTSYMRPEAPAPDERCSGNRSKSTASRAVRRRLLLIDIIANARVVPDVDGVDLPEEMFSMILGKPFFRGRAVLALGQDITQTN